MNLQEYTSSLTLLSEQVSKAEVAVILRELQRVMVNNVAGDVVEFGCYEGTTSVHLAAWLVNDSRELYLYDSFEGLPDKTNYDQSPAGMQFKIGELTASKKTLIRNIKRAQVPMPHITKAWFSDVAPRDVPEHISFAFLDGDYYESVRVPLQLIEGKLSKGATIVVDDYANEALPGAARAVDEWAGKRGVPVRVESSLAIMHL